MHQAYKIPNSTPLRMLKLYSNKKILNAITTWLYARADANIQSNSATMGFARFYLIRKYKNDIKWKKLNYQNKNREIYIYMRCGDMIDLAAAASTPTIAVAPTRA